MKRGLKWLFQVKQIFAIPHSLVYRETASNNSLIIDAHTSSKFSGYEINFLEKVTGVTISEGSVSVKNAKVEYTV